MSSNLWKFHWANWKEKIEAALAYISSWLKVDMS